MAKINEGDQAPDSSLPWTGEGEFSLAQRRGSWVILAFYPGDFTSVCTKQFCNYRDGSEKIDGIDAEVVGVSPQDVDSHEKFIAEHDLNVPLVADTELEAAEAYGVTLGSNVRRSVFVVDPEGKVRYRNVKMVGLAYDDADSLEKAFAEAQANAA